MKKILFTLYAALFIFSINASNKMTPYTQSFLNNYREVTSGDNSLTMSRDSRTGKIKQQKFIVPREVNEKKIMGVIISLSENCNLDDLVAAGVSIDNVFGDYITAHVDVDQIEAISELDCVKRISVERPIFLKNDIARTLTNASINIAGTNLKQTYTGKDVVYGTVDTGIDFNHLAFSDADGNTRIKGAYLLSDNSGTSPSGSNANGKKYSGSVYTTPSAIAKLTTDAPSESHGSHTAGIGAGSYNGNAYSGMAPDADLVLCGGDLSDVNIINGVSYVFDYAKSVNKPAVVNLSLGDNIGAHDGSSDMNKILDKIAGDGKIIVMSAGNEGGDNLYINKQFTSSTDNIKTFFASYNEGSRSIGGYFDSWSRNSTPFGVQIAVYSTSSNEIVYTSSVYKTNSGSGSWTLRSSSDSNFKKYYVGSISIYAGIDANSGKYNCWCDINVSIPNYDTTTAQPKYKIGVIFTGEEGAYVDAWIDDYYTYFSNGNVAGWTNGSSDCSINGMATGNNTISVGAYSSRSTYKNYNGSQMTINIGGKINDIAYFSSYGPDLNGIQRPDIVGPGNALISAVNSYDSNTVSTYRSYLAEEVTKGTRKHQWGNMSGTSMSSPAVAGILAQWLQADPLLNAARIKEIFAETAIKDSYVTNGDARKWGAGKIDANAGLISILKSGVEGVVKENNAVILYPNPSDGQFTVYAEGETGNIQLQVFSASGQIMYAATLDGSNGSITVNLQGQLQAGLYFVKIVGEKTNSTTRLIIK